MIFSKTISTIVDKGQRIIKMLGLGKDPRTAPQAAPYGVDSNPVKDMVAIYLPGSVNGRAAIVGYLNKSHLAAAGEVRLFSTDEDGALQTYVWCKANGDILLGGDTKHLMEYEAFNTIMTQMKTDINDELAKIAAGITGVGGAYTVAPLTTTFTSIKIDKLKTS